MKPTYPTSSAFCVLFFLFFLTSVGLGQDTSGRETEVSEAVLISVPDVKLPKAARDAALGGRVTVRVNINEKGKVTSVAETLGPDWVCPSANTPAVLALRDEAATAAMKAKFRPATKNGTAVSSTFYLDIDFPIPATDDVASVALARVSPEDKQFLTESGEPSQTSRRTEAERSTLGILNYKAIKLERPVYPPSARAVKAAGTVNIEVLIGEDGRIFSANPISGHPLLRAASKAAACKAEFAPTLLSGQPVKVLGVITYNFVP